MHELALARSIVAIAEEAANGRRVRRVTVEVGALSGVMPQALSFCFDAVVMDSAINGATLELVELPARARCDACGAEFEQAHFISPCSACGSPRFTRFQGDELNVKTLEIEEAA